MSRESAEARLLRLRQRLTITFALVAFAGIAGLAMITTIVDGRLRANRFDTELQGRAFRSAALVFFNDVAGEWDIAGVADDVVVELSDGVAVMDRASGATLFASAEIGDADALIAAALADAAEEDRSVRCSSTADAYRRPQPRTSTRSRRAAASRRRPTT